MLGIVIIPFLNVFYQAGAGAAGDGAVGAGSGAQLPGETASWVLAQPTGAGEGLLPARSGAARRAPPPAAQHRAARPPHPNPLLRLLRTPAGVWQRAGALHRDAAGARLPAGGQDDAAAERGGGARQHALRHQGRALPRPQRLSGCGVHGGRVLRPGAGRRRCHARGSAMLPLALASTLSASPPTPSAAACRQAVCHQPGGPALLHLACDHGCAACRCYRNNEHVQCLLQAAAIGCTGPAQPATAACRLLPAAAGAAQGSRSAASDPANTRPPPQA